MANDLKLNSDHDIPIEEGDLVIIKDAPEVTQSVKIRYLFIQGEWYFNYTKGVPWEDKMFTVATSYEQKRKILKDSLQNTENVNQIFVFSYGIEPTNRLAVVNYSADTTFGLVNEEVVI